MSVDARRALNINKQDLETWAQDTGVALSVRQQAYVKMSNVVMDAINQELLAYGFSQKALQGIYKDLIKDLGGYLSKEAELKAAKDIAAAFSDFAIGNVHGGTMHLLAAAKWGALGALAAGTAGTIAGLGSGGASSVGLVGPVQQQRLPLPPGRFLLVRPQWPRDTWNAHGQPDRDGG